MAKRIQLPITITPLLAFTGGLLSTASTTIGNGHRSRWPHRERYCNINQRHDHFSRLDTFEDQHPRPTRGAVTGTDYLTSANIFGYLFPGNATTTQIALKGG
jgi:hypothetical protein